MLKRLVSKKNALPLTVIAVLLLLALALLVSKSLRKDSINEAAVSLDIRPESQISLQKQPGIQAIPSTGAAMQFAQTDATAKISALKQIFESKNDNDPRLDSDFRNLSEATKQALKNLYSEIKKENRNERGTIVFLLAREVKSVQELEFFRKVLDESPCLSLQDCGKFSQQVNGSDHAHSESATKVTLLYPQIMALRMQERVYSETNDQQLKEGVIMLLQEATHSSIRELAQEARSILSRITSR